MKLKVCGLSNPKEIETCVYSNVDYCGFILNYTKSHRYISFDKAKLLTKINKGNTKYVGVLVEPTIDQLNRFSELNFDYFQLYGNFHADELMSIKEKFKKKIITSVQVKKKQDIDNYKLVESNCINISIFYYSILWTFFIR